MLDPATHVMHVILLSLCRHLMHCMAVVGCNMPAQLLFVWRSLFWTDHVSSASAHSLRLLLLLLLTDHDAASVGPSLPSAPLPLATFFSNLPLPPLATSPSHL